MERKNTVLAVARRQSARDRLLAKLDQRPHTAAELTMPERAQLRNLERDGYIRYVEQSGYWVAVRVGAVHTLTDNVKPY